MYIRVNIRWELSCDARPASTTTTTRESLSHAQQAENFMYVVAAEMQFHAIHMPTIHQKLNLKKRKKNGDWNENPNEKIKIKKLNLSNKKVQEKFEH